MTEAKDQKTKDAGDAPQTAPQTWRENVESIVIAVILAFLFRAFVAEAFVIPTGSMAPTLRGRHVDVTCPKCKFDYFAGASVENPESNSNGYVSTAFCPICRFPKDLDRRDPDENSFSGDRILVSKFAYNLSAPERYQVIVFKYPGNAKQNFIKRLIGLENELLRIRHGNIYTAPLVTRTKVEYAEGLEQGVVSPPLRQALAAAGEELSERVDVRRDRLMPGRLAWTVTDEESGTAYSVTQLEDGPGGVPSNLVLQIHKLDFKIARKSPRKQRAMLQLVDDTRHIAEQLTKVGWPARWQQWGVAEEDRRWSSPDGGRTHRGEAGDQVQWLSYRHLHPWDGDWESIEKGQLPSDLSTVGMPIVDHYAYNEYEELHSDPHFGSTRIDRAADNGMHWVGDLAVLAEVEVGAGTEAVLLDLVRGGRHFRCELTVASGQAALSIGDGKGEFVDDQGQTAAAVSGNSTLRGPGKYKIRFSNVDDQLRLWVNNRLVEFSGPTTYRVTEEQDRPHWSPEDPGDTQPVGIGVRNGTLQVSRLQVFRDIYYVAERWDDLRTYHTDYEDYLPGEVNEELILNPDRWETSLLFENRREVRFVLGRDQFLPLGDNSPKSRDGRLWPSDVPPRVPPFVRRELLIGEALLIYWPHTWNRPVPFTPDVRRMGLIR